VNHDNIIRNINSKLRSVVKFIGMGDSITHLLDSRPSDNVVNNIGEKIAFTNCNIFDGTHSFLKEEMVVLVKGEKILDVGHKDQIPVPDDFYISDSEGHTLMPGLIDNHIHLCSPFTYKLNIPACRQMTLQIAFNVMQTAYSGVTTVCDMGGPQGIIKEFSELADKGCVPGPRILNCYTLISPRNGKKLGYPSQIKVLNPFIAWLLEGQVATRPESLDALKKACYKVKDDGGTHIKTTYQHHPFSKKKYLTQNEFPVFSDDWLRKIFEIGKETGLVVDIHSPYNAGTCKCVDLAIEVGAKIRIQHITFDKDLKDTTINKMSDYGFYIIPTVMVYGDSFHIPEFISWLDSDPKGYMLAESIRQTRSRIKNKISCEKYSGQKVIEQDYVYFRENFKIVRHNTQKAHDAGIIGLGTDMGGTDTGFFGRIHSEVKHYEEFGIAGHDILKYLTSVNAGINSLNDRGVVQPGKLADLITVRGNPLEDPSVLTNVATVMKGGMFLKYKGTRLSS
jgi:imidazolonepropionase-like amidohydrolase